jgi:Zn-dependent peptidase ImmA (M78 family)
MDQHNKIQIQVDEFLCNYSLDYPVDIFKLAENAGYEVLRFYPSKDNNLPKVSGALVYNDEVKRIFINGDELLNRQRFTCAHELGHAVLHHKDYLDRQIAFRNDGNYDIEEKEANIFAACLLMPGDYLKDLYCTIKDATTIDKIAKLAEYFEVSTQAMFYRLKNMGLI